MSKIYTIGHSNRSQQDLIERLRSVGVTAVVDVRAIPRSGRYPQFNIEALREACEHASIAYHWAGRQLGGRRSPVEESPNDMLERRLRGYADHMNTQAFRRAIDQLIRLAQQKQVAIMCAEQSFQHCHRALIADYLTAYGVTVMHVIADGATVQHRLRPEARKVAGGLIYDRGVQSKLEL